MSYDTKCYDLAEAFLEDHPQLAVEKHAPKMAQEIQDKIEAYISYAEHLFEAAQALEPLVLYTAPNAWSLYQPGTSEQQIRHHEVEPLTSGEGRVTDQDYEVARLNFVMRRARLAAGKPA